jgi:beta-galactosidase
VAWAQLELPVARRARPAGSPELALGWVDGPVDVEVDVGPTTLRFDRHAGQLVGLAHSGEELLAAAPRLSLWRAATQNDGMKVGPLAAVQGIRRQWARWGLDQLEHAFVASSTREEPSAVVFEARHQYFGADEQHALDHRQRFTVASDGWVTVDEWAGVPSVFHDLARVGVVLALRRGHDRLEWFGPGPWETYPDRHAAPVGWWRSSVAEQEVGYVVPQEHGGHVAARWCSLSSPTGTGLLVHFDGDERRSFRASHLTDHDLYDALTPTELERHPEVVLHLDAAVRGLGTASCGPDTLERYLVRPGIWQWRWRFRTFGRVS